MSAAPMRRIALADVVRSTGKPSIESEQTASPGIMRLLGATQKSRNAHSAIFAEVKVDEQLGVVRVTRVVIAVAAGQIINPTTARSQILGGVVMGIRMALHEPQLCRVPYSDQCRHRRDRGYFYR